MKACRFITITLLCLSFAMSAEAQRKLSPADTLRSVVNNTDGSATFRIYAPEAETVSLGGDFSWYEAAFTKGTDGIWTAVIPKVSSDAYRYWFIVDGVKVIDPRYRLYSEITPIAHMTNGEDLFWARKDVPHGPVSQISYSSSTTGQTRSMHVWMPAGNACSWGPEFIIYTNSSSNSRFSASAGTMHLTEYENGKLYTAVVHHDETVHIVCHIFHAVGY